MTFNELLEAISIVKEDENKTECYQLYCAMFPNFTKETYKSFEEFWKPAQPVSDKISVEDILKDVALITQARRW